LGREERRLAVYVYNITELHKITMLILALGWDVCDTLLSAGLVNVYIKVSTGHIIQNFSTYQKNWAKILPLCWNIQCRRKIGEKVV